MSYLHHLSRAVSWSLVRALAVTAVCAGGVTVLAQTVDDTYPMKDWLIWTVLEVWAWCALLNLACFSFGHMVLTRWLGLREMPLAEKLVTSMAVGLVGFVIALYIGGALALFVPGFAIALPLVLLAAGSPSLVGLLAKLKEREALPRTWASRWWTAGIVAVGIVCLAFVYLECMAPGALNYDSRWYHLTVSQDYAREGRIVPFLADYNRSFPQLAGILHTWTWLLPGLSVPLRCMVVLHFEFCILLWTLVGIAAATAWLLGQRRAEGAWVALFLYPILYVYDNNIGGSADHFVGFFALPVLLAALRATVNLTPARCALLGILAAGDILTKYQAIYVVIPAAVMIGGRWLWLEATGRGKGQRHWRSIVTLAVIGGVLVSPHFIKNILFYHNPFYPFAHELFPASRPSQPDSAFLIKHLFLGDPIVPKGTMWENFKQGLEILSKRSFRRPFENGFLFMALLPLVPFLGRQRRLWVGVLLSVAALVIWGTSYPNERYAQGLMPVIAAMSAAIIVRAWELGWVARLGLIPLLGLQVAWSSDIPLANVHPSAGEVLELVRNGARGGAKTRFDGYLRSQRKLSEKLPEDAVVLFHNTRLALGLERKVLQDLAGYQGLIDYRKVRTPREMFELLRSFGVTHVAHERALWPALSKQEEVIFAALLARHATNVFQEGEYEVFSLPTTPPPVEAPYRVLSIGTPGYEDGIYPVESMGVFDPLPNELKHYPAPALHTTAESAAGPEILDQVDAVFVPSEGALPAPLATALSAQFRQVMAYRTHAHFTIYVRNGSRAR